jgi:hypothetical protein
MNTQAKSQNSKKVTKPVKYLRLPIDFKTQGLINQVKLENPFFSDVDAIFYMAGKYAITNRGYLERPKPNFRIGKILQEVNKDEQELTEDQMFQILKDNNLM